MYFRLHAGVIVCALLALITSSGCAKRETSVDAGVRSQTLYVGLKSDPRDLDPHIATDTSEFELVRTLMEGLTELDPKTSQPIPGVAERWEASPDGLTWAFHLRANARWSNGDPVTADDFVFGFRRVLSPALGAEYAQQLFCLAKASEYFRGRVSDFAQVGARAVDARTLVLTLTHPVPYLTALTLLPPWLPAHRPTLEKYGAVQRRGTAWTRAGNFVGNGAFVLAAWEPNRHVRIERSPTYWDRAQVRLAAAVYYPVENVGTQEAMFRSGQLHLTSNTIPVDKMRAYRADPARAPLVFETPLLATKFFRFNCTRAPLTDVRVRQALALAIDRQQLAERVLQQKFAARSFTPPDCAGYTAEPTVRYDPVEAKRLLAAAGFAEGGKFPRLELLLYQTGDSGQPVAEAIQQMWRRNLGIDVALVSQETKTVLDRRRAQDFDLLLSDWFGDYLDPTTFLDLWTAGAEHNKTGWSSAAYDQLLAEAARTIEVPARHALLRRAETLLLAEAPITPLFHSSSRRLKQPALKGWEPNPLELHPLKFVWLEK